MDDLRAENRRLAAELAELTRRHELVVAGAASAIWEWDVRAGTVRFSRRWAELRGYDLTELSGDLSEWSAGIHADDRQRVLDAVEAHFRGETPEFVEEYRVRRKDGTYIWILDRGVAARDAGGEVSSMAGSEIDITERRRAQEDLEESLRLLRASQEMGHVGSWEVDVRTGVEHWTDEVFHILGLDPATSEPLMGTFDAAVHPDDRDAVDREYNGSLTGDADAYDLSYRVIRVDDGETRWVRDRCAHERDDTGVIIRRVGTLQDITEYQRAREEIAALNAGLEQRVELRTTQLQAVNDELEAFAYAVSHDLRAPLRSIDGFAHILVEDYAEALDDTGRRHLERVRASAQMMGELIDELLQLSRQGREELRDEDIDLSSLAREVAAELEAAEPERAVEIEIAPDLRAHADRALTRVVLANLLGNAWRFSSRHESARVEVGGLESGGEQVFFVRDDGAGFDMAHADKLFGAFQRLHAPGEFEGTGIGLATVQRIVRRHGGRVWAEGAVEQGATFFFTLAEPPAL